MDSSLDRDTLGLVILAVLLLTALCVVCAVVAIRSARQAQKAAGEASAAAADAYDDAEKIGRLVRPDEYPTEALPPVRSVAGARKHAHRADEGR